MLIFFSLIGGHGLELFFILKNMVNFENLFFNNNYI